MKINENILPVPCYLQYVRYVVTLDIKWIKCGLEGMQLRKTFYRYPAISNMCYAQRCSHNWLSSAGSTEKILEEEKPPKSVKTHHAQSPIIFISPYLISSFITRYLIFFIFSLQKIFLGSIFLHMTFVIFIWPRYTWGPIFGSGCL